MSDVNNDRLLDLYVCCYRQPNKLFINDGKGHFTDRAAAMKLNYSGASMTMAWADTDNDGDLDCYLATTGMAPPPGTKFQVNMVRRASDGKEVPVVVPALEEFWQILILPNDRAVSIDSGQHDHLWRNQGTTFSELTGNPALKGPFFTLSATAWDYDADNHPDWYVANDYTGPDRLFHNRGDGTFEDRLSQTIPHTPWFSMGSDTGDVNNDGIVDLIATDMSATTHYREKVMMGNMDEMAWFLDWAEPRQFMRNALYLNTGTGRMIQASQMMGVSSTDWTWTPRLEDFDNDGWIDLFITNGIIRDGMNSDMTDYADKVAQARLAAVRAILAGAADAEGKECRLPKYGNSEIRKGQRQMGFGPGRGHVWCGDSGLRQRRRSRFGGEQRRRAGGRLSQPLDRRSRRDRSIGGYREQYLGPGRDRACGLAGWAAVDTLRDDDARLSLRERSGRALRTRRVDSGSRN